MKNWGKWIIIGLLLCAAALFLMQTQNGAEVSDLESSPSIESASALSWQDYYDLGVRYLSEGNYQEAILAFEMAIEIEPKRPEAYAKAAEAYEAAGDPDAARSVLERGYAETEDESLNPGPPRNERGGTEFTARDSYIAFEELPPEEQDILQRTVEAAIAQDRTGIEATAQNIRDQNMGFFDDRPDYGQTGYFTVWQDYKIAYRRNYWRHEADADEHISEGYDSFVFEIEIRPENGMGYFVRGSYAIWDSRELQSHSGQIIVGPCINWSWNGEMDTQNWHRFLDNRYGPSEDEVVETGAVINGLWHGEATSVRTNDNGYRDVTTATFDNGVCLEMARDGESLDYQVGGKYHVATHLIQSCVGFAGEQGLLDYMFW